MIKEIAALSIEREFFWRKMLILEQVRKKTTQKVNLYEKVQIPIYEDAIRKIKRFLEDEENLSKASQKILKTRISQEAAV
jgi:V/A-type H+-transporting ATPase subunit D